MNKNPYAISFGRIPTQYISRTLVIDEIIDLMNDEDSKEQAFKLTGTRGTGKTVTLTAIEKELKKDENWIVIGIRPGAEITKELIAQLYSKEKFINDFVDVELNLSGFGIGVAVSNNKPVASLDFALQSIMEKVKKRGKKVLVSIDEAQRTEHMIAFIQEFQLLIRNDYPIYFIAAGLYEDIEGLEKTDGLTFFLRASKYEMKPLNHTIIRNDYEKTLNVSREVAEKMAVMTKGYAFAYQAFGKYMWSEHATEITEVVLALVDEALKEKVYDKIWSELTENDKEYVSDLCKSLDDSDKVLVREFLEKSGFRHNEWSVPRMRLAAKGIINIEERGIIKLRLPRFKEYVQMKNTNN